jgi:hypothetical protein
VKNVKTFVSAGSWKFFIALLFANKNKFRAETEKG